MELKRQIYAWLLLSVFVPTMAIAALHVHDTSSSFDTTCSACVHHQAHAGHLTSGIGHVHDCVLCQLMATSFIIATFSLLAVFATQHRTPLPCFKASLTYHAVGVLGSRAPPME